MAILKCGVVGRIFITILVFSSVQAGIKDEMRNRVSFKLTELIRKLFPVEKEAEESVFKNVVPNIINSVKNFIFPPSTTSPSTTTESTETSQSINITDDITTKADEQTDIAPTDQQQTTITYDATKSQGEIENITNEPTTEAEGEVSSTPAEEGEKETSEAEGSSEAEAEASTTPSEAEAEGTTEAEGEGSSTPAEEGEKETSETEGSSEAEAEASTTPSEAEAEGSTEAEGEGSSTPAEEGEKETSEVDADGSTEATVEDALSTTEELQDTASTESTEVVSTESEEVDLLTTEDLDSTTTTPFKECLNYTPPPPALRNLFNMLKPHLNESSRSQRADRKKYPSYRKLVKEISKTSMASSSFKTKVESIISRFRGSINESVASQMHFYEATRVRMLFDLKNFVQKQFNAFTDLVSRSLKSSGVCDAPSEECWNKLSQELPRFMEDQNREIETCDDIFHANIQNPQGAAVRAVTVQRIGQEFGNIPARCFRSSQSNAPTMACLMKSMPYYVPRSAAYFSSLENAINQGTSLMLYVTSMAKSCYENTYSARTQLFRNGMVKLRACVDGEKHAAIHHAIHHELDK
ncbi:uncharacterized protein LOC128276503 [Anopheles cruzii]|uniref:uncharacterized protein LOC128276503 n=1 Tax=Anopheles cruzii TaxID=68878 RepID=UPI0022EC42C2|nr:uncharacterized protein LOC128276503 [Anopheles cruzii]